MLGKIIGGVNEISRFQIHRLARSMINLLRPCVFTGYLWVFGFCSGINEEYLIVIFYSGCVEITDRGRITESGWVFGTWVG